MGLIWWELLRLHRRLCNGTYICTFLVVYLGYFCVNQLSSTVLVIDLL
ncbi:hypothetical protein KP509_15G073400 [Ceratopteris richardii]|uniref:Uncharacterized protein n=1 Tax=Ceratopteris richardii TaxID=49495 RepID=A0A8T2T4S3_CERRI|nr:hypothetical protein KP509_15G073400 [Ceratopteris richardii]